MIINKAALESRLAPLIALIDQTSATVATVNAQTGPSVIRSVAFIVPTAANGDYDFPARLRPYDPTRIRCVIRNLSSVAIQIGYGSGNNTDLNNPGGGTFTITVPIGGEYLDTSQRPIFARPGTGVAADLLIRVETELGVA